MLVNRRRMILLSILFFLCLSACSKPKELEESTDMMDVDRKEEEHIYIFQMDGHTYTMEEMYEVNIYDRELEEGSFYELIADVEYLNGGIAGYVDFPDIRRIIDCKEVSPYEIGLPTIWEKRYGLLVIGDYAQGDLFLNKMQAAAVWKQGEWIYHYDKSQEKEDGTVIFYRKDVSEERIAKGIAQGILACEDYFVQPALTEE